MLSSPLLPTIVILWFKGKTKQNTFFTDVLEGFKREQKQMCVFTLVSLPGAD